MARLPYWKKPFKDKVFCIAERFCSQKNCSHKLTKWEKNTLSRMHKDQLIIYQAFPDCAVWNETADEAEKQMKLLEMAQVRFENE